MLKLDRKQILPRDKSVCLAALRAGVPTGELSLSFTDNPRSQCRLADIASARLWLAEGAPIADVLTMLEVRHRFDPSGTDCRAYAIEMLRVAQVLCPDNTEPIPNPKESDYAIA
jgi:hypothetical protein